jgi:hypothetical protein
VLLVLHQIAAFAERLNSYILNCIDYYRRLAPSTLVTDLYLLFSSCYSNWTVIRATAALFTGCLLGNLTPEQRKGININPGMASNGASCSQASTDLLAALIILLKEKSPDVRKKAAQALSMLTNY